MLRALRWQLILSHVLPLLVIIPIIGIALIYVLETRIVLATLTQELVSEANLMTKLARNKIGIKYACIRRKLYKIIVEY